MRNRTKKAILQLADTSISIFTEKNSNIRSSSRGYTIISSNKFIWEKNIKSIVRGNEDGEDYVTIYVK